MAYINGKETTAIVIGGGDGSSEGESSEVIAQSKTVTPTTAKQTVLPDAGYTHLSAVTVNPIPSEYIVPSGELEITANGTYDVKNKASIKVNVESGGEENQYLHTIAFTNDDGGEHTLTMTLVNNSSASLSGEYETEDTDIYNGAIIEGYESNGVVVGHYSNGGGGSCYLELEDGTAVNSFYGSYTDTVTEYSADYDANTQDATATAAEILSGKTAYVKGSKVTGTMINRGAITKTLTSEEIYTIPQGYHSGNGKVTAPKVMTVEEYDGTITIS